MHYPAILAIDAEGSRWVGRVYRTVREAEVCLDEMRQEHPQTIFMVADRPAQYLMVQVYAGDIFDECDAEEVPWFFRRGAYDIARATFLMATGEEEAAEALLRESFVGPDPVTPDGRIQTASWEWVDP